MSTTAQKLLRYAHDLQFNCIGDGDRRFCMHAARTYAAYLIAGGVQ